jgi:hypothetical protein
MNLLRLYILAILWTTECVLVHAQQLSRSQKAQSASSYVRNCLAEGQYLATGDLLGTVVNNCVSMRKILITSFIIYSTNKISKIRQNKFRYTRVIYILKVK